MNNHWVRFRAWYSLTVLKRPVREMPRADCQHSFACYLCPRSRCVGSLNAPDDPDLTKPRSSSWGHCIFVQGKHGIVRFRVSIAEANKRRARAAADEQEHLPPHLWKPPGYDEGDVPAFLKSIAD